jgi:hypothetical protein
MRAWSSGGKSQTFSAVLRSKIPLPDIFTIRIMRDVTKSSSLVYKLDGNQHGVVKYIWAPRNLTGLLQIILPH